MRILIVLFVLVTFISCIGCASYFPVQQSGMISSYPSGADLYLLEENSTQETYLGKTPKKVDLVSERRYQWKIKASHKNFEPLVWHVHGGKEIDHHFAFSDISKEMLQALQEKFKPYGFDVIQFVTYAKANLKARAEIDFGRFVPDIDFRDFKGGKYVEVKITYPVTYNTLRVSMYQAASMTFDEVVKKLATQIVTTFKKQDSIAGFIFNISYSDMDFLEKEKNITDGKK